MRGKYIVFEGMNGSGKSTLAMYVALALHDRNAAVASLVFPGRISPAGQIIRDVFEGKIQVDPKAMMWLFIAEGVDMESQIEEKLADGVHVLCDRHTQFSGRVYQSILHGFDTVHDVMDHAHFRAPDYLYIVDIPPKVALERRQARRVTDGKKDPFESEDLVKLNTARDMYRNRCVEMAKRWQLGSPSKEACHVVIRVLDGTLPIKENVDLILNDLET